MPASQTLDHLETIYKGTPQINSKTSQIVTSRRNERTTPTHMVHFFTRSFRNQFGRPKKQQPEGSVRLKTPKIILKTCTVSERTVCDIHIYDILPRSMKSKPYSTHIYYFCGGGWQSPPSPQHWQLCAKIGTCENLSEREMEAAI
jgi:hypothetical protein